MRHLGGLNRSIGNFATDRGGNFAIVFDIAVSTPALGVGFAAKLYNVKSSLRGAVDAAVTSKDASAANRHYFEASTGAELDDAFQEIIRNTEKIALTQ